MLTSIADLVLPPACALCRVRLPDSSTLFCEPCHASMAPCRPPACRRCGAPLSGAFELDVVCGRCEHESLAFERACAPFVYLGVVREAVLAFKYHGRRRIGAWLAGAMAESAQRQLPIDAIDVVAPVPMHWLKARLRGHSAAATLAYAVARRIDRPCRLDTLARSRWTATQTRLTTRQRFRNVHDAFRARLPRDTRHSVLLVDDVLTSGATADACARALRAAGARAVWVLTAACAPA